MAHRKATLSTAKRRDAELAEVERKLQHGLALIEQGKNEIARSQQLLSEVIGSSDGGEPTPEERSLDHVS